MSNGQIKLSVKFPSCMLVFLIVLLWPLCSLQGHIHQFAKPAQGQFSSAPKFSYHISYSTLRVLRFERLGNMGSGDTGSGQ